MVGSANADAEGRMVRDGLRSAAGRGVDALLHRGQDGASVTA